ncbi:MAG TPA: hypothetical protein VFT74_04515, partial [Isosphaeraceae bacterium]|nr:hypothetical protein [Isosphaeraceae bacterium]
LEVINASPSVQEMISRVRVAATPGYESALKPLGIPALEAMGREIDDGLREWRHKGMNGSPEERELFLGEVFHGARATMRLGLMAATAASPEKSRRQLLEAAVPKMLEFAHQQAIDSGFNEEQTELYIATQKRAYESLEDEP